MTRDKLNLDKSNLQKFGLTLGVVFFIIGLFLLARHRYNLLPLLISVIFFILTFMPILLKPIYILWMRLAFILAWINTRLILCIVFYLVFTPMGLVMRLFRIDLLDRKIDKSKESYWGRKEGPDFNPLNYERQF